MRQATDAIHRRTSSISRISRQATSFGGGHTRTVAISYFTMAALHGFQTASLVAAARRGRVITISLSIHSLIIGWGRIRSHPHQGTYQRGTFRYPIPIE